MISHLSARAWVGWSLAAVAVALTTANPVYRGLVAIAAFDVLVAWLPPGRRLRPLAFGMAFAVAFAVLINGIAGHGGSSVIVRIPDAIPIFGGPITVESIVFGGSIGLGLVAALLAVTPLSMVLESHEIVDALPARLERTGIAVATSLNLISGIGVTFQAVRDAQTMRGWRPRGIRSWREVFVPVVLTSIEDSIRLAEAMEARAFGAARRTSFSFAAWSRWDSLVVLTAFGSVATFVGFRIAGIDTDWYPYPSLYLPPVQPALVAACLLLALPGFIRRGPS